MKIIRYRAFLRGIALSSCQTDETFVGEPSPTGTYDATLTRSMQTHSEGTLTVGKKLKNPFSLYNMREAVVSMIRSDPHSPADGKMVGTILGEAEKLRFSIQPSHLYIKITPKNLQELNLLESDTTLVLYPYPLDHELIGEGEMPCMEADFDSETGEVKLNAPIAPLYAAIPVYKTLPSGIDCTILEQLYIPEAIDAEFATRTASLEPLSEEFAQLLTDQSMWLTGYATTQELQTRGGSWHSSGQIRVFDTELEEYVGVPSAKVRARSWFLSSDYTLTDKYGRFRIGKSFSRSVKYTIIWETRDWDIRTGDFGQASYHGPDQKAPWNFDIAYDGRTFGHATVTRALSSHFYGVNPFDNTKHYSDHQTKIAYQHKYKKGLRGRYYNLHVGGITPALSIYGLEDDGSLRSSADILNTVFHELGHCSMHHRCLSTNVSYDHDEIIKESWGKFIGWFMVNQEYSYLGHELTEHTGYNHDMGEILPASVRPLIEANIEYFDIPDNHNLQNMTAEMYRTQNFWKKYTPLFIDLIDSSNQREYYRLIGKNTTNLFPDDRICIKFHSRFLDLLYKSPTLRALKTNILTDRQALGVETEAVNDYFEFYGI